VDGKRQFRPGPFEIVCVVGGLAILVANTLSDAYSTLTLLGVAILAVFALFLDGSRG
jgi:hypothetical protein